MSEQEMLGRIDKISRLLYQNKTNQIWDEIKGFLQELQLRVKGISDADEDALLFSIEMMKDLVENYQKQDVIGIADCLQEKVTLFIQFYFAYKERKN